MENFLPRERSRVVLGSDGNVSQIVAICQGRDILFVVKEGQFNRCKAPDMPFFDIPRDKLGPLYRQVAAVIADYKEKAELARELKKQNWAFDLKKYGVIIRKDGQLSISRWHTKKDHTRERKWQTLPEIKSAIRQQDHIIEEYLEKKSGMENGQEIPPELSNLLKKLSAVLPCIEMRRELLIFAQKQMNLSIRRTIKGLELLLGAKGTSQKKCHGVPEKLERLAFFLKNNWPNPYREKIAQIMPLIKKAKKSATRWEWDTTESHLFSAKNVLSSAFETSSRQSPSTSISEINPIRILAEVDKYGLADEIMAIAKKHLPDQYLKYRGFFRLNSLLAVSQLVITGKSISQEEILKIL